jgi:hypothetical protein
MNIDEIDVVEPYITMTDLESVLANERRCVLFFDIETRPADEETLRAFFKEEEVVLPNHPGEFDPAKVKYGNTQDVAKKREKLHSDMAKHRLALANWETDCEKAKQEAWEEHVAKSTLSSLTGRVMAIGYGLMRGSETQVCLDVDPAKERPLVERFWKLVRLVGKRGGRLVSFNGSKFDLPFMTRRSWAYEDVVPPKLRTKYNKYEDYCVDTAEVWKQGVYGSNGYVKLDQLAQMMGCRRKLEGMSGAHFHSTWREDEERARKYLELDVLVLSDVARRMGVV